MIQNKAYLILLAAILFSAYPLSNSQNVGRPPKYERVKDWLQLPEGYILGQPTGIGIDSRQNVFVFHRANRTWIEPFPETFIPSNTVLVLEKITGKVLDSWGTNRFIMPHGLTVDKQDNIWLTDVGLHQIFKFTREGKLLMKLGIARTAGSDSLHFNQPTDVAVAEDGSFYVSDGYGNSRVMKFSANGKYLFQWGKKGDKAGEFNIPHSIDLDAKGNVYVADRENNRIQAFDPQGKFLKEWKNESLEKLYSATIDKTNQRLFAVDYLKEDTLIKGSNIMQFDSIGNVFMQFGRSGLYDGPVCRYHDIAIDKEGSIYVGDILGNKIQKFKLIKQ